MKIKWNSPYTPYTHGYRCDNCGKEEDTEMHNACWFQITCMAGQWDLCSQDCVRQIKLGSPPKRTDYGYVGGTKK